MAHATIDLTDRAHSEDRVFPGLKTCVTTRASKPALSNASKTLQTHPVSKASLESGVPLWWHLCGRSQLAVSRYRKS
jgi:hypothetical protein